MLLSATSYASPLLNMKFHMGVGGDAPFIGGTLVNTGNEGVEQGYIIYSVSDKICAAGKVEIYHFDHLGGGEKLSFKIPVKDKLKGYKILSFGGIDHNGIPVDTSDETSLILKKKVSEEKRICSEEPENK